MRAWIVAGDLQPSWDSSTLSVLAAAVPGVPASPGTSTDDCLPADRPLKMPRTTPPRARSAAAERHVPAPVPITPNIDSFARLCKLKPEPSQDFKRAKLTSASTAAKHLEVRPLPASSDLVSCTGDPSGTSAGSLDDDIALHGSSNAETSASTELTLALAQDGPLSGSSEAPSRPFESSSHDPKCSA